MSEKNLYYLHELSDYKVASDYPDVRGWELKDAAQKTIGKIDNLLVNKKEKRVVYLDVEVDEALLDGTREELVTSASDGVHEFINKDGDNHLIVPIGMVDIDEENKRVFSNEINYETFKNTRRFTKGSAVEPGYELTVYRQYVPSESDNDIDFEEEEFYNRKEFKSRYNKGE